ncbi:MAG: hypothetical protein ACTHYX_09245, partial [Psychrobacter sp.]|nr:hypothetical protein [Psychrobacter sp.]
SIFVEMFYFITFLYLIHYTRVPRLDTDSASQPNLLPHVLDESLLFTVATLDRRLDSALLCFTVRQLRQRDLSEKTVNELCRKSQQNEHRHHTRDHQYYAQQQKNRTMLLRYQRGLLALFGQQLSVDLTQGFAHHFTDEQALTEHGTTALTLLKKGASVARPASSVLVLW